MKLGLLMSVVLIFALFANVYGEDCDLAMQKGNFAQDLDRVLRCLNDRMRDIEVKTRDMERRFGGGEARVKPLDAGTINAGPFMVSVTGASRKESCIHVSLLLKNNTTEEMFLVIEYGHEAFLIDEETGASSERPNVVGINVKQRPNAANEEEYSPVMPNAELPFSLKFCLEEFKRSASRLFKLNLNIWHLKNKKAKKIAVPLNVTIKGT